jgi:hypothetical protein
MKHFRRSYGQVVQALAMLSTAGMFACTANVTEESPFVPEPVAQGEEAVISGASVSQLQRYYPLLAGSYLVNARSGCPSGSVVVGGGYDSDANGARVYSSGIDGNGWSISAMNLSNSTNATFRVFAECLSGTNATTGTTSPATVVIEKGGGFGCAHADCPSGKLITGGGFTAPTSFRASTNQSIYTHWEVCGWNEHPTESIVVQAYPVCVGGVSGQVTRIASPEVSISARTEKEVLSPACKLGVLLGSGGFQTSQKTLYVKAMGRPDRYATKWTNTFYNLTNTTHTGIVSATCLDLWP